jgi:hypothetical protein
MLKVLQEADADDQYSLRYCSLKFMILDNFSFDKIYLMFLNFCY